MHEYPSDVAFTPAVKAIQAVHGSRGAYAHMEQGMGWQTTITPELSAFIASLDMFYLSTANSDGQPYIQYRGGPKGFLKVLDERTLAFADFRGNRQYISVGNLSENPKAFLFLMDYASQSRVKVWGSARILEGDEALLAKLWDKSYHGTPERAIVIEIAAWDANCRQHIHRRYDEARFRETTEALRSRVRELETEVARLLAEGGALRGGPRAASTQERGAAD